MVLVEHLDCKFVYFLVLLFYLYLYVYTNLKNPVAISTDADTIKAAVLLAICGLLNTPIMPTVIISPIKCKTKTVV